MEFSFFYHQGITVPAKSTIVNKDLTPQERYLEKPFEGSSHTWALAFCESLPAETKVLDIGPGSGLMGRALKSKGFSELYAVEIDEAAREHVNPIYKQVTETITPYQGEQFDLVLLMDVLEHMVDPESFLREVSQMVAPGGHILISLPNICHWSIRLTLLFGRFEYTDRGILDRTHLQFFSRKRFMTFLQNQPELHVHQVAGSLEPAEFVLPRIVWDNPVYGILTKMRLFFVELLPGLFAYQHLAILRK